MIEAFMLLNDQTKLLRDIGVSRFYGSDTIRFRDDGYSGLHIGRALDVLGKYSLPRFKRGGVIEISPLEAGTPLVKISTSKEYCKLTLLHTLSRGKEQTRRRVEKFKRILGEKVEIVN